MRNAVLSLQQNHHDANAQQAVLVAVTRESLPWMLHVMDRGCYEPSKLFKRGELLAKLRGSEKEVHRLHHVRPCMHDAQSLFIVHCLGRRLVGHRALRTVHCVVIGIGQIKCFNLLQEGLGLDSCHSEFCLNAVARKEAVSHK